MSKRDWKGVEWPKVVNGVCSKHGARVGPFTGVCTQCHHEQLEAAGRGSREWERKS